jgi:hypothetical protein
MSTSLDVALDLWHRGLSVIPVPRPRPGIAPGSPGDGKVPAIAWKEFQTRRPTEDELRDWFATDQNVAIITGRVSNVVVVDADSADALAWIRAHLTRTPWQTKTSRGFHLFYRYPGVPVRNRARLLTGDGRLALDVRGDGGFVIGPGSVHAKGHVYAMAGDWSVPSSALPAFWVGLLERPRQHPQRPPSPRPTGDVVERARRYLAAVPTPIVGQGSDAATFSAAARLVRGFDLQPETAVCLLQEWAPSFDRWWIERKVECAVKYADEPVGGLK